MSSSGAFSHMSAAFVCCYLFRVPCVCDRGLCAIVLELHSKQIAYEEAVGVSCLTNLEIFVLVLGEKVK